MITLQQSAKSAQDHQRLLAASTNCCETTTLKRITASTIKSICPWSVGKVMTGIFEGPRVVLGLVGVRIESTLACRRLHLTPMRDRCMNVGWFTLLIYEIES